MTKNNFKGCLILALTSFIWGAAFVAQSVSMEHIGPFTFNFCRSILGMSVLFPITLLFGNKEKRPTLNGYKSKKLFLAGCLSGVFLFAAMNFQQFSMYGSSATTPGKCAFVTAMYIVFSPVLGIFLGKRPGINVWLGISVGIVGLYLLCMGGESGIVLGDILSLFCAFLFSFQILTIDKFSTEVDCIKMSCIQFGVCTLLSLPFMIITETPSLTAIWDCRIPILYTGVLSSALAYTLQIVGQKYADVTPATLTMSFESVFAALAGWVILKDSMDLREILGCILIFAAVVISQITLKKKSASKH